MSNKIAKKETSLALQKERSEILSYIQSSEEYTQEELLHPIQNCWVDFMISQVEKGNSNATLDYYRRFYKKFCSFLQICGWDENTQPIVTLVKRRVLFAFQVYLENDANIKSPQTINSYKRAYRSFGMFCQERGYFMQGSFKCEIKEIEPPIKAVYTEEELKKLLVKPDIKKFAEYRNYVIINLLLCTGARSNTILNIKTTDVDLDSGSIIFNTTKTNKVVSIDLPSKMIRLLSEYIYHYRQDSDCEYLFVSINDSKLTRGGLAKAIQDYNKSRGVNKTSLHLFRHTFAKAWIMKGGDIYRLKKVLTHNDLTMVQRYSNLYGADVRKGIEDYSLLSQITPKKNKHIKYFDKQIISA